MSALKPIVAALVATSMLATPLSAQQRTAIGNASTVVGDVRMSNQQITKPVKIKRKQRIAWGDLIDTRKKSQLQILLLDRSTFGIGANSRVRIDRFVYDPNEGRSFFATFVKGALRFFSGSEEGENSGEIQTPSGRIGIRGTALDMLVGEEAEDIAEDEDFIGNVDSDKDEATLVVLRGPGAGTAGGLTLGRAEVTAAGETVVLDQPGLAAYIPRNGAPPIGPFFLSSPGLSEVQGQLQPEVARAADGGNGGGLLRALLPVVGAIAVGSLLGGSRGSDNPDGRTQDDYPDNRTQSDNDRPYDPQ
ncbi:FecR family protein [Qipengyuania flava]|uniref:FecR family protein n=1 Tax=Qipengyuania flava TaxID=192812 RepID=UPI001C62AD22|nr:FecR domain-containing protein [Qipengyuania flava]QYJ06265.1 FecR family protein [Qipengyuania flava]